MIGVDRPPLSPGQRRVLDFIRAFTAERNYPPTFRQIAGAMGTTSTNAVACHIKPLIRKGYLVMDSNLARTMRIVEAPETQTEKVTRLRRELRDVKAKLAEAIAEGGES